MCYTAQSIPGSNSTTAIGFAKSADMGITWVKDAGNPIITQGTYGSWDYGRIETGSILFNDNELKIYYDGSGSVTGNMGRVGLATTLFVPVSIEKEIALLTRFSLEQNYPNPFNPSTKIKYSVPQTSPVQIKIFGVLGNEIETLVNEGKPAGTYEVEFNASSQAGSVSAKGGYASGVYFYQFKASNFVQTKKMLLLK